jgi:nitrate reductase gamma subunit
MDHWLDFAQGPLLRFALLVMFLGLARQVFLAVWGLLEAVQKAQDKNIPYGAILVRTMSWLVPVRRLHRNRAWNNFASFFFHVGLLLSALFLQEHIDLWESGLGIRWPALSRPVADGFTLLALGTGILLLFYRVYIRDLRFLSRPVDYLLLLLLLTSCASGYVAARPWNPIPYDATLLIHVLSGVTIFVCLPFTKLAHCVLFPLVRLCSEVGWHFRPRGGADVALTLYGEEARPV